MTELLSPAGTLKSMRYAFAYGADAVYAGQPRYSLRVRNNEFNRLENLEAAIKEAHAQNKKFYLASNVSPHNDKVKTYLRDLEPVIAMQPDALIMSDPGLIMLVREKWPEQAIHLSVQANAVNYASVQFWAKQGVERVILSRELSLSEIEDIRSLCPETELEVFVHGALCIAYSGRCLLSGYMNHRDPNQGACTNACRWEYDVKPATEDNNTGSLIAKDTPHKTEFHSPDPVLIHEKSRPDETMEAYEDEHGTYIMNSKDLRAVQHVDKLTRMGIHSLKIEGRTKSHYYVARTAQIYRKAIDAAKSHTTFDMSLFHELDNLSNRGYTEGFYRRHTPSALQSYEGPGKTPQQQFVGEVVNIEDNWATIYTKNHFSVDDTLELITPAGNQAFQLQHLEDAKGQALSRCPGSDHRVKIQLPFSTEQTPTDFGLLVRNQ